MRYLLILTLFLPAIPNVFAAEAVHILDITEQHGSISAHFILSGTTIIVDETGQPQVSPVDQLQAVLTVEAPEGLSLQLPTFTGATFGDFTLVDRGKTNRQRAAQISTTTSWLIAPYNPGEYGLPTLSISGIDANGNSEHMRLSLPAIQVADLAPPAATDFDLLPPRPLQKNIPWATLALGLGSMAALIALALFIKRNRRCRPPSPKQRAMAELQELSGSTKEKAQALSIIIRRFMDGNFNLTTQEKTYQEYAPFIKKHPQILKNEVVLAILHHCDQSNYASSTMTDTATSDLIQQTQDYIKDCPEPLRPDEDSATCGRW